MDNVGPQQVPLSHGICGLHIHHNADKAEHCHTPLFQICFDYPTTVFSVLQEENSIFLKFSGKSAQRRVFEQSAVLFAVKAHNIDANVHLIARVLPLCFIEQ